MKLRKLDACHALTIGLTFNLIGTLELVPLRDIELSINYVFSCIFYAVFILNAYGMIYGFSDDKN